MAWESSVGSEEAWWRQHWQTGSTSVHGGEGSMALKDGSNATGGRRALGDIT